MKKYIAILPVIALLALASPAYAGNGHKSDRGGDRDDRGKVQGTSVTAPATLPAEFDLTAKGTVTGKAGDTVTLKVENWGLHRHGRWFKWRWHKGNWDELLTQKFGDTLVVKTTADTKIKQDGNDLTLAQIAIGNVLTVTGHYANSTFTASKIKSHNPPQKAYGTVTAKTANTVTIQNTVTGTSKTVTVDEDTKVNINGEAKALADVQVGDKGSVKFKDKLGTLVAKIVNLFR